MAQQSTVKTGQNGTLKPPMPWRCVCGLNFTLQTISQYIHEAHEFMRLRSPQ